jgi:ribose 5-phosphate isomerase B
MDKVTILIASDHAGFKLKESIKHFFASKNVLFEDHGCFSEDSVDYPDFAHEVAKVISKFPEQKAILVCGSGNGVSMAANKHPNVRAAVCWLPVLASLARTHNNANILCLPARFISENHAYEMINIFLSTDFEGGRHTRRVEKIELNS